MAEFDDLRILKTAEAIADSIWKAVARWDEFPRDTLGKQLARAAVFLKQSSGSTGQRRVNS